MSSCKSFISCSIVVPSVVYVDILLSYLLLLEIRLTLSFSNCFCLFAKFILDCSKSLIALSKLYIVFSLYSVNCSIIEYLYIKSV